MSEGLDARTIKVAKRLLKIKRAKDSLLAFTQLTMPSPEDPSDSDRSMYDAQHFHRLLVEALEQVESGEIKRLIVTMPPRHGKSELTSRRFPAWFVGRNPYRHIIFGTYNQTFADDYGRDVRGIMQHPAYSQVFPGVKLQVGSQAADRLKTEEGGMLAFVGRGGSVTGRGAHLIIIDDPLKNSDEADSQNTRDDLWDWYKRDMYSRRMNDRAAIIVIQTRWSEDDLVGRLTDPKNPHYDPAGAADWKIFNIPALAEHDDILGREVGEALWPTSFSAEDLLKTKAQDPRGFNALYQQRPTPEDGEFFKAADLRFYTRDELPEKSRLRIYATSDHAVATKQENDKTCLMIVGVDEHDVIWILDVWWGRYKTDEVVEQMVKMVRTWNPITWFSDKDHVSKSIGPFLKKRLREEKVYVSIREIQGYQDKKKKAQSIQGRMAMGMVMFPKFGGWVQDAKEELLKFPRASHDDFVDALSHLGLGLNLMVTAAPEAPKDTGPKPGSLGWIKAMSKYKTDEDRRNFNMVTM